jgi:hypothetical protein
MAKRKVKFYIIGVNCAKCGTLLYKYRKEGPGHLVKCYKDGILEDNTNGDLRCSVCGQEFARNAIYHNRPAYKIIQGKVVVKGYCGK